MSTAQLAPPGGSPLAKWRASNVQRAPEQGLTKSIRSPSVHTLAEAGTRGSGGKLPHLKTIQRALPEHDLSQVRAYTGERAESASRAMGASAYAFGNRIAFVQRNPSLHTATHEAAHVLQQRAGIQLKGGIGKVGDPYERNADAIANAVVSGRTPPPVLGGRGSTTPSVQRLSAVGNFVTEQRKLMAGGRKALIGKYTTVGFEFEFATMAEGSPFSGLSHVELAKSPPMPDPEVPFILETDASDALELVSPPFWLPTFGDTLLPEPDRVDGVISIFKERLNGLTKSKPTILELTDSMKEEDDIDFALRDVSLARENLTPRTKEGLDVDGHTVGVTKVKEIKLKPIDKFRGNGIDAQVNIATDAFGNDLLNQAFIGDRFSEGEEVLAFEGLERKLLNILYKAAFKPLTGWGRSLQSFENAYQALLETEKLIRKTLVYARSKLRLRIEGCWNEKWYPDSYWQLKLRPLEDIAEFVGPTLTKKLRNYNVSPFEISAITEQLETLRTRSIDFIASNEKFLNTAKNAGPSQFEDGDIDRLIRTINVKTRSTFTAIARIPHVGSSKGELRIFLNALARTLSGQLAVHSIDAVRKAQEERLEDPSATMGKGDLSFGVHRFMSSRVKDVRGIWAKAPVLDIGLGILSFKDWQKVSSMMSNRTLRTQIAGAVTTYESEGKTLTKESVEPLIQGVLDGIQTYISDKKLTDQSWFRHVHTVRGADRRKMKVGSSKRPDFMSHDKTLMTPRQDTFVPLEHVQMPEVWGDKTRQFVVESRTNPVETLRRIKKFTG